MCRLNEEEKGEICRAGMRMAQKIGRPFVVTFKHGTRAYNGYQYWTTYVNGYAITTASGGGYDIRGTALAEVFDRYFSATLKQYAENPAHEIPYCMRPQDGIIDGGCGVECVRHALELVFGTKVFDDGDQVVAFVPTTFVLV